MSSNFRYNLTKTIKPYVKYFPQLTKPVARALIQVSVDYIESSKCPPQVLDSAITKLKNGGHTIPENVCELFAAILQIMELFLHSPNGIIKSEDLSECLKVDLRLDADFVEDVTNVLHKHRNSLSKNFVEAKMIRRNVTNLQFRINISFLQGITREPSLTQPTIVLHFQLPDGRYRTLELTVDMFHRLRHTVDVILSEMQQLSQRAVMKKF